MTTCNDNLDASPQASTEAEGSVLLASERTSWGGFPVTYLRSESARRERGMHFASYWVAFVTRGACSTILRTGSRTKNLSFSPGFFAGYPPGCHWDAMSHDGTVESICIDLDWKRLGGEVSVSEAKIIPALHACDRDQPLMDIARAMAAEIRSGCPTGRIYAECLSIALNARLMSLAANIGRRSGRYFRLSPRNVARLIELIDSALDADLSVHRLAQEVGLSSSHFAGCFVETFGCSVHQFVLGRRVRRAVLLLESGLHGGADIALQCGFASQSHFSSVFRKMVGTSPSHYVRRH